MAPKPTTGRPRVPAAGSRAPSKVTWHHHGLEGMRDGSVDEVIRGPFLIDAHVHLHGCFDEDHFLASAAANFAAGAQEVGAAEGWTGWLLFTEVAGEHRFRELAERGVGRGGFTVGATAEAASLIVSRRGAPELVLVAGRQLRARGGLEVLALGTTAEFPDGLPLAEAVAAVRAAGALAIVPWGFGKWWFGRKRALAELLESAETGELFLGDNGNRARLSPTPAPFRRAARRRIWVLPGSDPLPLGTEVTKVGRYGLVLEGDVSCAMPARDLIGLIRAQTAQPPTFGRREGLGPFARNQIAMQLRGRRLVS